MEERLLFFEYNGDLLERIVGQQLIHMSVARLLSDGGSRFTTVIDADLYSSPNCHYEKQADAIALATVPIETRIARVELLLDSIPPEDIAQGALPYLRVRRALTAHISAAHPDRATAAACDLTTCYLLSGEPEHAASLWRDVVRVVHRPVSVEAVEAAVVFVEAAITALSPVRTGKEAKTPSHTTTPEDDVQWIAFTSGLSHASAGAVIVETLKRSTTTPQRVWCASQIVVLQGLSRLSALSDKAQSVERQMTQLAKATRVATNAEALHDTVAAATRLSSALRRVREDRAGVIATIQAVVECAFSASPPTETVLAQHAAFAVAFFALVWNRFEDSSLAIECAKQDGLLDSLGEIVLRTAFAASGTRRVLLWCLIQMSRDASVTSGVALSSSRLLLPPKLASAGAETQSVSTTMSQRLEEMFLADPDLPITFRA